MRCGLDRKDVSMLLASDKAAGVRFFNAVFIT